ncbi:ligase-associated DNA damage response endonuclease PdeM [bacterium]|nr:ligase-associated DNA damage response endonuclease PdeM [bacterium]
MQIEIGGKVMELLPQKALWWPQLRTLVVADVHLGKASHFRKSGIPVPFAVYDQNVLNLIKLLQWKKPSKVLFLGDLFHSVHNREWNHFAEVMAQFPQIEFVLVVGNHDILGADFYRSSGLSVFENMELDGILFSHDALNPVDENLYNIYGHIHPGVRLVGKGRQSLRLPCFYFMEKSGILPAFGQFTGLALQKPKQGERVYVVAENKIVCVS